MWKTFNTMSMWYHQLARVLSMKTLIFWQLSCMVAIPHQPLQLRYPLRFVHIPAIKSLDAFMFTTTVVPVSRLSRYAKPTGMIGVSLTDGMVTRRHESCSVSKTEAARGGTKAVGKQDLRLPHLMKMDTYIYYVLLFDYSVSAYVYLLFCVLNIICVQSVWQGPQ